MPTIPKPKCPFCKWRGDNTRLWRTAVEAHLLTAHKLRIVITPTLCKVMVPYPSGDARLDTAIAFGLATDSLTTDHKWLWLPTWDDVMGTNWYATWRGVRSPLHL